MLTGASTPPTTTGGTWAMGDDRSCTRPSARAAPTAWPPSTSRAAQGSVGWCARAPPRVPRRRDHAGRAQPAELRRRPPGLRAPCWRSRATAHPVEGRRRVQRLGRRAPRRRCRSGRRSRSPTGPRRPCSTRSVDGTTFDLGPGTTGSLAWCGAAAYFVRDPQTKTRPGPSDAVHPRRQPFGGLREQEQGQRLPLGAALRRRRDHADQLRRAGDEQVTVPLL